MVHASVLTLLHFAQSTDLLTTQANGSQQPKQVQIDKNIWENSRTLNSTWIGTSHVAIQAF